MKRTQGEGGFAALTEVDLAAMQRNQAIVAVAREFSGFIRELLRTQSCYQAPGKLVLQKS